MYAERRRNSSCSTVYCGVRCIGWPSAPRRSRRAAPLQERAQADIAVVPDEKLCATLPACSSTASASLESRFGASQDGGRVAAVAKWVLSCGAFISENIEVRNGNEGERGIFARIAIQPGELILSIPSVCHFSSKDARKDEGLAEVAALNVTGNTLLLAARLLLHGAHTATPVGPFTAYFGTLPHPIGVPLTWPEEDLKAMIGSRMLMMLGTAKRKLLEWHQILRGCRGFENVAWDDFVWAVAAVQSRTFDWKDGIATDSCMVPFADLFNHDPNLGVKNAYNCSGVAFDVTCKDAIPAGQQIYLTYGPKGNEHLLVHYGFALEPNEEETGYCPDEVMFRFSPPVANSTCNASNLELKRTLLQSAGYSLEENSLIRVEVTYIRMVSELMSVIRLLVADDEDMKLLRSRQHHIQDAHQVKGLTAKNERSMLMMLWRYVCVNGVDVDISSHPGPLSAALTQLVDVTQRTSLDDKLGLDIESDCRKKPLILALMREALKQQGAVRAPSPEEARSIMARVTEVAASDGFYGMRPSVELRALLHRERRQLVRIAVESERRVFAHFAALVVLTLSVSFLQRSARQKIVERAENCGILAGLTPSSRQFIAKYITGFCRCFGPELHE